MAEDQAPTPDATITSTVERCAKVAENMPLQIYSDDGTGPAGRSCRATTFDDIAAAIRALAPRSDAPAAGQEGE